MLSDGFSLGDCQSAAARTVDAYLVAMVAHHYYAVRMWVLGHAPTQYHLLAFLTLESWHQESYCFRMTYIWDACQSCFVATGHQDFLTMFVCRMHMQESHWWCRTGIPCRCRPTGSLCTSDIVSWMPFVQSASVVLHLSWQYSQALNPESWIVKVATRDLASAKSWTWCWGPKYTVKFQWFREGVFTLHKHG